MIRDQTESIFPEACDCDYTPFYCEENIWKLCEKASLLDEARHCHVVFISNEQQAVPLWKQRAATGHSFVVWDYHVILLYSKSGRTLVYDFDTTLGFPCDALEYISETFRPALCSSCKFKRCFRVVNGNDYLRYFSSDRRHMLEADGNYKIPPPPWPMIYKPAIGNKFPEFKSMDEQLLGNISKLYNEDSFFEFVTGKLKSEQ